MKQLFVSLLSAFIFFFTSCDTGLTGTIGNSGNRDYTEVTPENDSVDWDSLFDLPEQDSKGWSILTPSADSRLIYVSNGGKDDTACVYSLTDAEVGENPFLPAGEILSYGTIDAALEVMRDDYPDYLLLKRGDVWVHDEKSIRMPPGRSVGERSVSAYYGNETNRPVVKTGNGDGIILTYANYSAVMGIHFVANERNPDSEKFIGFNNVGNAKGFQATSYGSLSGYVLLEDCWFDWYSNNTI